MSKIPPVCTQYETNLAEDTVCCLPISHHPLLPCTRTLRAARPLPSPRRWPLTVPDRYFLLHLLRHTSDWSTVTQAWPVRQKRIYEGAPRQGFPHFKKMTHKKTLLPVCLWIQLCENVMPGTVAVTLWLGRDTPKEERQQNDEGRTERWEAPTSLIMSLCHWFNQS